MRFLLKEDDARLKELALYINDNVQTKKPNTKKPRNYRGRFLRMEIEQSLISEKMAGNETSIEKLFLKHLNSQLEFVCSDISIEINHDFIEIAGHGFTPNNKWNKILKEKEDLISLENQGYEYVLSLNQGDIRNFFESNNEIRYGIRSKNLEEPRLLGEITDSLLIMTSEDYDKKLTLIKLIKQSTETRRKKVL